MLEISEINRNENLEETNHGRKHKQTNDGHKKDMEEIRANTDTSDTIGMN